METHNPPIRASPSSLTSAKPVCCTYDTTEGSFATTSLTKPAARATMCALTLQALESRSMSAPVSCGDRRCWDPSVAPCVCLERGCVCMCTCCVCQGGKGEGKKACMQEDVLSSLTASMLPTHLHVAPMRLEGHRQEGQQRVQQRLQGWRGRLQRLYRGQGATCAGS